MLRAGADDVRGCIIGGVTVTGYLTYKGKQEGAQLFADTWGEVVQLGKDRMQSLKDKYAGICYDDDSKWEVTECL